MLHGFYRTFEDLKPQEVEINLKPSTMASLIATEFFWYVKKPHESINQSIMPDVLMRGYEN